MTLHGLLSQVREENKEGKHFLAIFYQVTGTKWGKREAEWALVWKNHGSNGFYRETTKNSRHAPARLGKPPLLTDTGDFVQQRRRSHSAIQPLNRALLFSLNRRFQRGKPDSRFTKTIAAYSSLRGEHERGFFLTIFLIITGRNNIEFIRCFKTGKTNIWLLVIYGGAIVVDDDKNIIVSSIEIKISIERERKKTGLLLPTW